jgi:hypothetical protein
MEILIILYIFYWNLINFLNFLIISIFLKNIIIKIIIFIYIILLNQIYFKYKFIYKFNNDLWMSKKLKELLKPKN